MNIFTVAYDASSGKQTGADRRAKANMDVADIQIPAQGYVKDLPDIREDHLSYDVY
jgi:hypothetical protein